jgi:hypothetical protein
MAPRPAQAQYLYGITNAGSLYEINPITQNTALAFAQPLTMTNANGLAWNEADKRMFYFGEVSGVLRFYVWDRKTGIQTQIGGTIPAGPVASGTYYNNYFWYVRNNTDTLVRLTLDFSTPGSPRVSSSQTFTNFDGTGTTSFGFGDISVRASDGMMFGSSNRGVFRVSVASGVPTGFTSINSNATLYQLGFGQNNVLYGETSANGNWYTLNTTTGTATSLGYTSRNSSGTVVAFNDISEGAVHGVAAMAPEPNSASLLLTALTALTGLSGSIPAIRRISRRKA